MRKRIVDPFEAPRLAKELIARADRLRPIFPGSLELDLPEFREAIREISGATIKP